MSISERARKHRALIFDRGADFFRDQKTIGALKLCKKEEVADYLERTIAKETSMILKIGNRQRLMIRSTCPIG